MNWTETLSFETNKLKLLLYIEQYGLPLEATNRTRLLVLLNDEKGYPVRYVDMLEWLPIINDYWSFEKVKAIAQNIQNPMNYKSEILVNNCLTDEEKALALFALPL